MARCPAMPQRTYDLKSSHERSVFHEFATRFRPDIDPASIASGNPLGREPDILAKSTEGDWYTAFELVRLTEASSQILAGQGQSETSAGQAAPASSVALYNVHAFAEKFRNARRGHYEGVPPQQLELLAYSEHLLTPWQRVLDTLAHWLTHEAGCCEFTQVWIWQRERAADAPAPELWRWSPKDGLDAAG